MPKPLLVHLPRVEALRILLVLHEIGRGQSGEKQEEERTADSEIHFGFHKLCNIDS